MVTPSESSFVVFGQNGIPVEGYDNSEPQSSRIVNVAEFFGPTSKMSAKLDVWYLETRLVNGGDPDNLRLTFQIKTLLMLFLGHLLNYC